MGFTLDEIVPWGRSFDEYLAMFSLTEADLGRRILGCGDGPASFNAALAERGGQVVSADPLYRFAAADIRRRIEVTYDTVMAQTRQNAHEFIWDRIGTPEELGRLRLAAMEEFLNDYPSGRQEGRYLDASLPGLPFRNRKFDLAICSHLLFLYSEQLSESFHLQSIKELRRVAGEVRIFPLLELGGKKSRHLLPVIDRLRAEGLTAMVEPVPYEFQKGGNEMLRVN